MPSETQIDAQLIAAAKMEGELNTIALQHDWCSYGELIKGFKSKYGLQVNELNPKGGSEAQIEAVTSAAGNAAQTPDVIDVSFAFSRQLMDEGLVQPYKVSVWDSIPAEIKDPAGYWYAGYYSVMTFEVNREAVKNIPQDWPDLLSPDYKGAVALGGDPLGSVQAQMSVYLAALANGGSLDHPQPGLEFFKQLNEAGNFVPFRATQETIARGQTPIVPRWSVSSLGDKKALAGNPHIEIVIPASGTIANVNIQAIPANAPHPNAARLWMEFLYSDEGQLYRLKGNCLPARYNDLAARNAVPVNLAPALPQMNRIIFPTAEQILNAQREISNDWMKIVGVDVK